MSASDKDDRRDQARRIRKDAEPQFAGKQAGGENNGVDSAKPKVITGSDDATIHKWEPGTEDPPREWSDTYDLRSVSRKDRHGHEQREPRPQSSDKPRTSK